MMRSVPRKPLYGNNVHPTGIVSTNKQCGETQQVNYANDEMKKEKSNGDSK